MNTLERWERFWDGRDCPLHREDTPEHYALYAAELRLLFGGREPGRILEIGCGNGALFPYLGFDRAVSYRGVDISQSMIANFKKRHPQVDTVVAGGHSYRDDGRYDMVFSNGVVQHFDGAMLEQHVANAETMLEPGGLFVCGSVPWRHLKWPYLRGQLGGLRPRGRLLSAVAYLQRAARDPLGRWFNLSEFDRLARRHGMTARHFGSVLYMYRFHTVLQKGAGRRDGAR